MIEEMPKVQLRGVDYQLEPLGIADIFNLKRLAQNIGKKLSKALDVEGFDLAKIGGLSNMQRMKVLMTAIDVAEDELYELLGTIIGLNKKELQDKNKIPADAPIVILSEFWDKHPDIKAYKKQLGKLSKNQTAKKED